VLGEVSPSFVAFPNIHFLVDIPGTPWESSSVIIENPSPGPFFDDKISIRWTIQHLIGPHPTDINPNPPVTLSLTFTPTAPGAFGSSLRCNSATGGIFSTLLVNHPLTTGGTHFDDFFLCIDGFVTADLFGSLRITSYDVEYRAFHCENDPTTGA